MGPFRVPGMRSAEEVGRVRIAEIADAKDVRWLLELCPFLPARSHPLGPDAERALGVVLDAATPLRLAWFDSWCRGHTAWAPAWDAIALESDDERSVVALATFHRSGFVRERAIRILGARSDGFELPFLLLRANDWVAQVQGAAIAELLRRVVPAYAGHWARSLALLERLAESERRRLEIARLRARVDACLGDPAARAVLAQAIVEGPLDARRAAIRVATTLSWNDARPLLESALHDGDPFLSTTAARALVAGGADIVAALLPALLAHPASAVRLIGFDAAERAGLPVARDLWRRGLFDRARSVRERARHELSKAGAAASDFAALYREALDVRRGREWVVALHGLAEIGGVDEVPIFLAQLGHPSADARAAAISGVGRVDGANHHDALYAGLEDRSSCVRRAAARYARIYLGRGAISARRGGRG